MIQKYDEKSRALHEQHWQINWKNVNRKLQCYKGYNVGNLNLFIRWKDIFMLAIKRSVLEKILKQRTKSTMLIINS